MQIIMIAFRTRQGGRLPQALLSAGSTWHARPPSMARTARTFPKVEGRNFSIRKNVLNYDDVMNTQREIIYKERQQVLDGEDLHDSILKMME